MRQWNPCNFQDISGSLHLPVNESTISAVAFADAQEQHFFCPEKIIVLRIIALCLKEPSVTPRLSHMSVEEMIEHSPVVKILIGISVEPG